MISLSNLHVLSEASCSDVYSDPYYGIPLDSIGTIYESSINMGILDEASDKSFKERVLSIVEKIRKFIEALIAKLRSFFGKATKHAQEQVKDIKNETKPEKPDDQNKEDSPSSSSDSTDEDKKEERSDDKSGSRKEPLLLKEGKKTIKIFVPKPDMASQYKMLVDRVLDEMADQVSGDKRELKQKLLSTDDIRQLREEDIKISKTHYENDKDLFKALDDWSDKMSGTKKSYEQFSRVTFDQICEKLGVRKSPDENGFLTDSYVISRNYTGTRAELAGTISKFIDFIQGTESQLIKALGTVKEDVGRIKNEAYKSVETEDLHNTARRVFEYYLAKVNAVSKLSTNAYNYINALAKDTGVCIKYLNTAAKEL